MRPLLLIVTAVLLAPASGPAPAADKKTEAKGKKVEYEVHSGYLMRLKAYLDARAADKSKLGLSYFMAFTDQDSFDKVFGKSDGGKVNLNEFIPNGEAKGVKPKFLPKDAFDKKLVVAASHHGQRIWKYKVAKVTADGDTLYVQYQADSTVGYPNGYACPLIVSVGKGKYASVVFIENGKEFGTATIGTEKEKGKEK
jgi:hypothetical protein